MMIDETGITMKLQPKDYVNGTTTGIAIAVVCGLAFKNWPLGVGLGIAAAVIELVISTYAHREK